MGVWALYGGHLVSGKLSESSISFPLFCVIGREFRDVVFEDVVFDNDRSVTPY